MTTATIPLTSLQDLRQGRQQEEFRRGAVEIGAFYLSDYGISEADHQVARDAAMEFFRTTSPADKQAVTTKVPTSRRGYSGLGAESTAIVTNTGTYSDYSMSFSMGMAGNLFPSVEFERIWGRYFERLHGVAREVARQVLRLADPRVDAGTDPLPECDPVLRLRYFPEVPHHRIAETEPLRMAPHYDLSIVTLIHQTPCPNGFVSLQVEVNGRMVNLPVVPDTVVVMCGAVGTLLTRGVVPAPRHHVAAPAADQRIGSDRTSSVFFLRPSPAFAFSVQDARNYGFDVSLAVGPATFGDWVGTNYGAMHTTPEVGAPSTTTR